MGCCPSKEAVEHVIFTESEGENDQISTEISHATNTSTVTNDHEAPTELLMIRDGWMLPIKSENNDEYQSPPSPEIEKHKEPELPIRRESRPAAFELKTEEIIRAPDPPSSEFTPPPSPPRTPSTPRKPPVNFDEVPINSMYHRIHTVKVAEQDAKRHEELQLEAEQHEQEVREYKAAMLSA